MVPIFWMYYIHTTNTNTFYRKTTSMDWRQVIEANIDCDSQWEL